MKKLNCQISEGKMMAQRVLSGLNPKIVWELFEEISKIPRESKKEEKIRTWIKNWANNKDIKFKEDEVGNLLLKQKSTIEAKHYPGIILQCHCDMVAQKTPDSKHNFDLDPIQLRIIDNYVTADATTLGADNGIGMALALAIISDSKIKHGPIDVLITVDEETGLTGALAVKREFFNHTLLLNLDSEKEGEITISSAGGGDTTISIPTSKKNVKNYTTFKITIEGLKGGHSGIDIHLPRLNAIKLMVESLETINNEIDIDISRINGGSAHNAIPRDCMCEFLVNNREKESVKKKFKEWKTKIENYRVNEPNIKVNIITISSKKEINFNTASILNLLKEIPHGPIAFSKTIPDLVETSNNLALIKTKKNSIKIVCSTRSSIDEEINNIRMKLVQLGKKFGAEIDLGPSYPGWEPELDSSFLKLVHQEYEREYGKKVELKAIHAGLECGLFKGVEPDLEIVSLGPEIKDAHSPEERVFINSVELIWRVLKSILVKLDKVN